MKKYIKITILIISMIVLFGLSFHKSTPVKTSSDTEEKGFEAKPLVINTEEPSTYGTIIMRAKDTNEIVYMYKGDNINIENTGKTGDDIYIEIIIPTATQLF